MYGLRWHETTDRASNRAVPPDSIGGVPVRYMLEEIRMKSCATCGSGLWMTVGIAAAVAFVAGGILGFTDDKPVTPPDQPAAEAPKQDVKPDGKSDAKTESKPEVKTDAPKQDEKKATPVAVPVSPFVLEGKVQDIDGGEQDLSQFKGKVVLIVNVASKCGFTPQYSGLEKLYKEKKDKGLVVLGFPSNDFGRQEPGSEAEIKEFCSSKYSVTFPMFSKVGTTGEKAHPLYKKLASQPKPIGGEPGWNFTKFLVNRDGNVVARFDSRVKPDDAEMNRMIDELLAVSSGSPETVPAAPAGK